MERVYTYEMVEGFRKHPDQLAELITDVVNSYSFGASDHDKFAKTIMNSHRTLQQLIFGLLLRVFEKWQEAWEENNYDARNEFACRTSNVMMEGAQELWEYKKGERIYPPLI